MIVAFCNPLLDVILDVDAAFLAKWNLKNDDAILADSKYQPLMDQLLSNPKSDIASGGACQNTLAYAQWILGSKPRTAIVGAIGSDKNGDILKKAIAKYNIKEIYQTIDNHFTGCCAILVCEGNRSMVASVAASEHFKFEDCFSKEVLDVLDQSKIIFLSTFFIRTSQLTALALINEANIRKVPLGISLSSPSAIDSEVWFVLRYLIKYSSLVFGNEVEIEVLSKKLGFNCGEDFHLMTSSIAKFGKEKIVVATRGDQSVVVAQTGKSVIEKEVIKVPKSEIVDTNGAGDSFCGGFLASFVQGNSIEKCVDCGLYCSYENIHSKGARLPSYPPKFK